MKKKKEKSKVGIWFGKLVWGMLFGTIMVLFSPTPERDEGPPKVELPSDYGLAPSPCGRCTDFTEYLTKNGYEIIEDKLPTVIEVKKNQVGGNPPIIVQQLAKKGYEMMGSEIKVVLNTWGGKYIGEYSPPKSSTKKSRKFK